MDKASDFESEDCEFESRRGREFIFRGVCLESSRVKYYCLTFLDYVLI